MSANQNKPSKLSGIFGRWRQKAETEDASPVELEVDEAEAGLEIEPSPDTEMAESNLPEPEPEPKSGLFSRWRRGLSKTGETFGGAMGSLLRSRTTISEDVLEEIETQLLVSDVGLETATYIVDQLKVALKKAPKDQDLYALLKQVLVDILETGNSALNLESNRTNVIMVVGVNGVGKTTSIGKLAKQLSSQGQSVTLAAGDTFRAAAVEQLQVWGERNQIPVIAQNTGSDSASVIFDALQSGRARGADIVIADTAGRLHNKSNLMEELSKVVRVMQKQDVTAPHETLLVLDACTGQNAINQALEFSNAVPLTGIVLTKMDGTAKGGVIFSLIQRTGLPVKFVGLGEGIDDLVAFDSREFAEALFPGDDSELLN